MHEDPSVPNYGTPGHGVKLRPGMTIWSGLDYFIRNGAVLKQGEKTV